MLRNDYRRALIMLRAVEKGYAGHARLERRTLTGSMCFTASAPGAARLHFAAALGQMRRDGRGQYGLNASFDPRNIAGKELEDYALTVIAAQTEQGYKPVLMGNVAGSVQMELESVREAVCALFEADSSAAQIEAAPLQNWSDAPAGEAQPQGGALADAPAGDPAGEPAAAAEMCGGVFSDEMGQAPALETQAALLDTSRPWPSAFEGARELFETGEAMEEPPVAGYVFVREALAEGSPFEYVAVGVRVEDGAPASLVYAFPAAQAGAPPAGFEDCVWLGGSGGGWWVRMGGR